MSQMTVTILGLGDRGLHVYGEIIRGLPEEMRVVAVADRKPELVAKAAERFGLAPENCMHSDEELFRRERLSDVIFICTQDRDHVEHAVQAVEKGYHVLLEKPISPDPEECNRLLKAAQRMERKVCVCHVLRYTPFYSTIKGLLDQGSIGRLMSIQAREDVGFFHQAHSYVRGNWRRSGETSPMILAKCCHDLDLFVWLSGRRCRRLSSFGALTWFREENAPKGSGCRCMVDCTVREDCPYDCEKVYLTGEFSGLKNGNSWPSHVVVPEPTEEKVREALRTGPYGRCVYRCDNDVVDHQQVMMVMEDDILVTLSMCAFSHKVDRQIKLMGTMGEIEGRLDDQKIYLRPFGKAEKVIDLKESVTDLSYHAGGDVRLVRQFADYVMRDIRGDGITDLAASIESHRMAFAAEQSRLNNGAVVDLEDGIGGSVREV